MENFPCKNVNGLIVTEVKRRGKSKHNKQSLGWFNVTFNDSLRVNNLELRLNMDQEYLLVMPYHRDSRDPKKRIDYTHPLTRELHDFLLDLLIFCQERFEETGETSFGRLLSKV